MSFLPVILWSDGVIWLLVFAFCLLAFISRRSPPLLRAWRRVGQSRQGMASGAILLAFVLIGLLDSLHYRPRLESDTPEAKPVYAVQVLSALDAIATPLRTRIEKTYSAPFATHAYAKESMEVLDANGKIQNIRDFPLLKYGGAHLQHGERDRFQDIALRVTKGLCYAIFAATLLFLSAAALYRQFEGISLRQALKKIIWGETLLAWNAVLWTLTSLLIIFVPLLFLCVDYHVFGTDKVGQDIFYQILKSIRTALVIGFVTTLVTLPLAITLGVLAGYFRGWVDDLIQYVYITLSSIPGVLLIAASVLMMQLMIDTHPEWFATSAERADLRLLALCFIFGVTSWTSLCRLLRGETLKLRTLEYVQAAEAFGVPDTRILFRHIMPNLMHLIVIALVMDFSGLVLSEAVLSYIGIGVDPSMISFGTMINNARMELAREPVVWWSLSATFIFMLMLILAANFFADTLREAFDPRLTQK